MNTTSISTLVEGATVTGIVQSKNQHGVTLDVAGQSTFLPVGQLGDTPISDLAKGTELAVTVVDTTGAKPRVAIATPDTEVAPAAVVTEVSEVASVVTEVAAAAVETEEESGEDDLSASIAKLAGAWGASVKFEKARTPSTKPAKPRAVKVAAAVTAPVVSPEPVAIAPEPVVAAPAEPKSAKVQYLESLKIGETVKATVKFKKDFGAFMTVGGIGFGLLHVSEMPGTKPEQRKTYLDGLRYKQELTCHVVSIDLKEERLGLSMIAGEKEEFFSGLAVGAIVEGTVSGTKEIGAFINLGVTTGFLHVSEVNGQNREVRDASLAAFQKGEKLQLVVVDVNRDKKEVRLSQRRLGLASIVAGSTVSGTFVQVRNNVVVLDLEVGARGFLPKQAGKRYENGETVEATVKSVDVAHGSIELV